VELTKVPKSGGRRRKRRGGRRKNGEAGKIKWDPCAAAGDHWSPVGPGHPSPGRRLLIADQRSSNLDRLSTSGRLPATGLSYCCITVSNFILFF
jgi:hypothetical protein